MNLRYVLDEHLRRRLWRAIQQHNRQGAYPLDVVRVGDPSDLPLGTLDPEILLWAEKEGRIFVTEDRSTMPGHLADFLQAGHHSPGVFLIRPRTTSSALVTHLILAAYAGDPAEWIDRWEYIP